MWRTAGGTLQYHPPILHNHPKSSIFLKSIVSVYIRLLTLASVWEKMKAAEEERDSSFYYIHFLNFLLSPFFFFFFADRQITACGEIATHTPATYGLKTNPLIDTYL